MSVTSQLRNKNGPLWHFFKSHENIDGVKSITSLLRATSTASRPPYNGSYKYSITGTAFPYVAHILLPKNKLLSSSISGKKVYREFNIESSVAFHLADHRNIIYFQYKDLIDKLLSLATNLLSSKNDITLIAKGAIIFAILEITVRGNALPKKLTDLYQKYDDTSMCIHQYLYQEIECKSLIDDIVELTKSFLKANKPSCNTFNNAKYFRFDKKLWHSRAVGGADIDVALVRGKRISIIDYKTILKPIDNNVTRQILSYALLWDKSWDGDNINLSSIGIYYTRTAELKEITVTNAMKTAFPKTITLKKTRDQLISSFSEYAERNDILNEAHTIANLKTILGK